MGWRSCTLSILNGETESEELDLQANGARRKKFFTIISPTVAEVVTVQLADKVGGTYATLNDGFGNDVTLLSGKAERLDEVSAGALKLVADGAVAADRVFVIQGVVGK
jgi:hypothetical protein